MNKLLLDKETRAALRGITGNIHHTESFGAVDGPGIRFVLFLQGCPLRCLYCHNPDAIPTRGGKSWTAGQAADEALRYIHFIRKGGVTFSGGEPLLQPAFVEATIRLLKEQGLHTAIDTSGCMDPSVPAINAALSAADMILLDVKAANDEIAEPLTGRSLANTLATLAWCETNQKPVWVRHVLVQGYTLQPQHTRQLGQLLAPYRCIQRVELLPFHKLGEPKWQEAGLDYKLGDTPATTAEQVTAAAKVLEEFGVPVW